MFYDKPLPDSIVEDDLICLCAFRYAIGRMTYVPSHVVGFLQRHWSKLHYTSRDVITLDLSEEIRRDDESRLKGNDYHPLGHDCDRQTWVNFRNFIRAYDEQKPSA